LLLGIYMILVLTDYEGGFDNFVTTTIFQPILGGIICFISIFLCFLVGLPIRFAKTINNWWTNHFFIPVVGIVLGISLIIISFIPALRETVKVNSEGVDRLKEIPNVILGITGWFVTGFFALHTYPPTFIRTLLNKLAAKLFPQSISV